MAVAQAILAHQTTMQQAAHPSPTRNSFTGNRHSAYDNDRLEYSEVFEGLPEEEENAELGAPDWSTQEERYVEPLQDPRFAEPLPDPVAAPQRHSVAQELKIFVGGLAQETTKESLNAYFSQFGQADSYVMLDGRTGRSRGFGFVNFLQDDVMQTVLAHQHQVDGVMISCSEYKAKGGKGGHGGSIKPTAPHEQPVSSYGPVGGVTMPAHRRGGVTPPVRNNSFKLFVGDLSKDATEDMLEEAFSAFQPSFVTVCRDSSGRSKGFGIVEFSSEADAKQASLYSPIIDGILTDVSEYWEKECSRPRQGRHAPY